MVHEVVDGLGEPRRSVVPGTTGFVEGHGSNRVIVSVLDLGI